MLEGQAEFLHCLQHLAAEAHLAVHHGLFHGDDAEAQPPRDAGDDEGIGFLHRAVGNHGADFLRGVGVADIGGDARPVDGEHAVFMKHGSAHVAQLPKLPVGDAADGPGLGHDMGVGHQEAVDVRPVFIQLGISGPGHDGAGNIAAAPGEGVDLAVPDAAVESGNDGLRNGFQLFSHHGVGAFAVKGAVVVEKDQILGIQKCKAQIIRQKQAVEILAPAGAEVLAGAFPDQPLHLVQLPGDGEGKPQLLCDGQVALPNPLKNRAGVVAPLPGPVGLVQQIGDLFIFRKTPSGCAGHYIAAARIHSDNIAHLPKLSRVRQGTAAEFDYDFSHEIVSSKSRRANRLRSFILSDFPPQSQYWLPRRLPDAKTPSLFHGRSRKNKGWCRICVSAAPRYPQYSCRRMLMIPTSQNAPSEKNAWRFTPSSWKPARS